MKVERVRRAWEQKPQPQTGRKSKGTFYHTYKWRKLRRTFFSQHPLCQHCSNLGMVTAAKELDHIQPVRDGGSIWATNNLQGLCTHHHAVKSGKERQNKSKG